MTGHCCLSWRQEGIWAETLSQTADWRQDEHYKVPLKHVGMFPDSASFNASQNNVFCRISLLKQISKLFMWSRWVMRGEGRWTWSPVTWETDLSWHNRYQYCQARHTKHRTLTRWMYGGIFIFVELEIRSIPREGGERSSQSTDQMVLQ